MANQQVKLNYCGVTSVIEHFPAVACSLGIFHSVVVPWSARGKGLGTRAHEHRLKVAKAQGFKYVLCSVRKDNEIQRKILAKFNWKELDSTDTYCHNISMFGRDLSDIELDVSFCWKTTVKEETNG